jgi:hypothetical protein
MASHLETIDLGVGESLMMGLNPLKILINPPRVKKRKFIPMLELKIACLNLLA